MKIIIKNCTVTIQKAADHPVSVSRILHTSHERLQDQLKKPDDTFQKIRDKIVNQMMDLLSKTKPEP